MSRSVYSSVEVQAHTLRIFYRGQKAFPTVFVNKPKL